MKQDKSRYLKIRVLPNAKIDQIVCMMDDGAIKVRIRAKPVDGKANRTLLKFLAKKLSLPIHNLTIKRGARSRNKEIEVFGLEMQEIFAKLGLDYDDP